MGFRDNRQYIEALEKTGDLVRVKKEIDWDLEIGAIIRRSNEARGPAVLFERVKDYPGGHRILGGPLSSFRRLSVALGLAPGTPFPEILAEYGQRLENPIKPNVVSRGPCQENRITGDEVDLFDFPAPMIHEGDGGRYIGTWHILVTKDPDSDWVNWGLYRLMVHDKKNMVGILRRDAHGPSILYQKYAPQGKPMPFAVAIGADPLSTLTAGTPYGRWESEADYAGALLQQPVELVKCETNDLLVPAHAEIILEGEILPGVSFEEGPFGEFAGYSASPRKKWPAYRVQAVTHRNHPILPVVCHGLPIDDGHIIHSITRSHLFTKILRSKGIVATGVYLPPEGAGLLVIVGLKTRYSGAATQLGKLLMERDIPHYLVVVDGDVDIYNLAEVIHAMATGCHPGRGIKISPDDMGSPLVAFYSPEERKWGKGAKAVLDCTFPLDWPQAATPRKMAFRTYPEDIQARVEANWKSYGFD